ncbi:trehalase-like [Tribolium madens]|uniref:trehalase-like n=1 Tax=Tribolium madens TaxID=41895 RepID=UPI001CF73C15|nr:trehalase-like [Tribolium madens]XP_044253280.1 trehalase-like [Tribolium madens]XP_044253281.1 trehalase-like [Tribolium madens]
MKFLLLLAILTASISGQDLPSCDSKVYCQGNLLHTVQMAKIFNDSKTFVDMKMVNDEKTTLANFDKFWSDTNQNPSKDQVRKFVNENFEMYNEFDDWVPGDLTDNPEILSRIDNEEIRQFTQDLVNIWPKLARKIKKEVIDNPGLFTLLPVDNGFVIPGGRFKEFYYWDSYWIIKGLLVSQMNQTVRGMLDNFLSIVDKYGFLPNGARIYYLNRSQPPLLNLMVATYIDATNDTKWLQDNIKILDKELRYWLDNKLVEVTKNGTTYTMAHYDSESGFPRPESYYEDVITASTLSSEEARKQLYADLKSGAESGWDFSTRWIVDETGGTSANLTSLHTRRIIPVDLNSFLCQAFRKLAEFYVILHDYENSIFWYEKSFLWQKTIDEVLYNKEDGIWYDWDNELGQHRKIFFPSNFAPLWAEAYDLSKADVLGERAAQYADDQKLLDYEGGIPASLTRSGEQWDYPNAWPPLQSIVVMGLDRSGNCQAKELAKELARRWVTANLIGFNQTNEMFEKYDAEVPGQYGGGGEYVIQSGFGWTNGVALEFIERFYTVSEKKH